MSARLSSWSLPAALKSQSISRAKLVSVMSRFMRTTSSASSASVS
jgi:hypothetical protein